RRNLIRASLALAWSEKGVFTKSKTIMLRRGYFAPVGSKVVNLPDSPFQRAVRAEVVFTSSKNEMGWDFPSCFNTKSSFFKPEIWEPDLSLTMAGMRTSSEEEVNVLVLLSCACRQEVRNKAMSAFITTLVNASISIAPAIMPILMLLSISHVRSAAFCRVCRQRRPML